MSNHDVKCDGCSCEFCATPAAWRVEAWFEEDWDDGYTIVCMCEAHLAEFRTHIERSDADPSGPFYWHGLVYIEDVQEVAS